MPNADPKDHLKKAAEYLGSAAELARTMGIAPQYASDMLKGERPIPAWRCPAIEYAVQGRVTCEKLAPTGSWVRIPDPEWPHPKGRPLQQHPAIVSKATDLKAA